MNINKIVCSLTFAGAILAIVGCPRSPIGLRGAIGEIRGTISWPEGVLAVTTTACNAIPIEAGIVKFIPSTQSGTFDSTVFTRFKGVNVTCGPLLHSGSGVAMTYVIGKLPLDTAIRVEVKPTGSGIFVRDGNPQDAICTQAQPTVSQFDFQFIQLK